MLENLREKLYNVQQDISSSLKHLKTGDVAIRRSRHYLKNSCCDLNAGADILHHFHSTWEELHNNSEENAKHAEELNNSIGNLASFCQQQLSTIQQLNGQLVLIPRLHSSVLALMNKIGELEGQFGDVENALLKLEDVIETQELQEKQLDQRFQLALHKERHLAKFDDLKIKLAENHAKNVIVFEEKQKAFLKEREELFQEAFEEEMKQYKEFGHLERKPSSPEPAVELSEIVLEDDEQQNSKLAAFLESSGSNVGSQSETSNNSN